jgi:NAD(P)-dependent dehydrogenase (short-subunit alcohol dehydrogenase family)
VNRLQFVAKKVTAAAGRDDPCEERSRLSESIAETGQKTDNPTPQQAWDVRAPTVPLRVGWLQPDDISPAAVFLASDAANMVTGAEYEVTGGDSAKSV